jgi:DNA modification methylase
MNNVYNINCIEGMKGLDTNFIDMCITSPPYDKLRTYEGEVNWSFDVFKDIASELYRVMKKGGVVVWVVGDAVIKGSETGSSFAQVLHFMDLGFKLHDTMIYEKNGTSFPARRDGNRYSQIFEYMFVLSKDMKPKTANLICDKKNKWAGHVPWGKNGSTMRKKDGTLVERKQKPTPDFSPRNNIWRYNTGKGFSSKDKISFQHPATFPEQLVMDHILTWSKEDDIIFDPFMGAGTTAVVARDLNRNFLGFELVEKYYNIILKRLEEHICLI